MHTDSQATHGDVVCAWPQAVHGLVRAPGLRLEDPDTMQAINTDVPPSVANWVTPCTQLVVVIHATHVALLWVRAARQHLLFVCHLP